MQQETLHKYLHYDPDTGVFTWKVDRRQKLKGKVAGNPMSNGYLQIMLEGKTYLAHRLVWLYMTGEFPPELLDHKDKNRINNKWDNLRPVTRTENTYNKTPTPGKSGLPGVEEVKTGFRASISVNNKSVHLGVFASKEAASEAYLQARNKYYIIKEYNANHSS